MPWKLICVGGPKDGECLERPEFLGCAIEIPVRTSRPPINWRYAPGPYRWRKLLYEFAHIDEERRVIVGLYVRNRKKWDAEMDARGEAASPARTACR